MGAFSGDSDISTNVYVTVVSCLALPLIVGINSIAEVSFGYWNVFPERFLTSSSYCKYRHLF